MTDIDILALIYAALQLADLTTTILAIRAGGREANPLVAWLIDKLGWPGLALAKVAALGAGYWLWQAGSVPGLLALTALYAVVVIANARKI